MADAVSKIVKKTLTPEVIERVMGEVRAQNEIRRKEAEDRRCLRGAFAPPKGVCRVCGGDVVAEITFPWTGRLGGPPPQARIRNWACEECGLLYRKPPPPKKG